MIEHRIDPGRRIVFATISGRLTDDEAIRWYDELVKEIEDGGSFGGIIDTRTLDRLDMSSRGVRQLTERAARNEALFVGARWAVIAVEDEVFGMARMYQILRSDASYRLEVFREAARAYAWLGIADPDEE